MGTKWQGSMCELFKTNMGVFISSVQRWAEYLWCDRGKPLKLWHCVFYIKLMRTMWSFQNYFIHDSSPTIVSCLWCLWEIKHNGILLILMKLDFSKRGQVFFRTSWERNSSSSHLESWIKHLWKEHSVFINFTTRLCCVGTICKVLFHCEYIFCG